MSQTCQQRSSASSFDHLVSIGKQRAGNCHVQCFRSFQVDDQLELCGTFNRQVGWSGTVKNLINIRAEATIELGQVRSIGHQAAAVGKAAKLRYSGDMTI